MILSAQTIRRYAKLFKMVEPFHERTVDQGTSYGLSAAGYDVRVDLQDTEEMLAQKQRPCIYLARHDYRLASTMERFNMPNNVMGIVHDKSSWARKGVTVQNTVIEPGWCGYLTLELTNHGNSSQVIYPDMGIAQVVFHFLDDPTEQPYDGKYQNQERGPQEARYEQG
jgi:dCTP deaminase